MLAFGMFVIGKIFWVTLHGGVPQAITMGAIGLLALAANVGVALLLYAYR